MPPLRTPLDGLTVEVDWNRDNAFSHADSNITQYVRSIEWRCGAMTRDQLVAPAIEAQILLDNASGSWTYGKGGLTPPTVELIQYGTLVRVRHSAATTANGVLLLARVAAIAHSVGPDFSRTATLTLTDWISEMQQLVYDPPFSTNVTTGALVSNMFDTGVAAYPYESSWWQLNVAALDISTYIYDASGFKPANTTGYTTLPYAGDNLDPDGNGVNAVAFLEEMAAAEMDGRAYYNPALARMVYQHRNWWGYQSLIDALPTFFIAQGDMLPESFYGADLNVTAVDVVAYPRAIGVAGSTLYAINSPIRVNKGDNRQIVARFKDPAQPDKSCGASTIITPVAGTDYIANTRADGTGAVMTAAVGISLSQSTNSVTLNISNNDPVNDLFMTTLQIRGTPITTSDAVTIRSNNGGRIRGETRIIGATGNLEDVQQYADAYVRRKYDGLGGSWQRIVMEVDNQFSNFEAGYVLGVMYPDHFGPIAPYRFRYSSTILPTVSLVGQALLDTAQLVGSESVRPYSIISRQNRIDVDSGRWTLDLIVQATDYQGAFVLNFQEAATLDENAILGL